MMLFQVNMMREERKREARSKSVRIAIDEETMVPTLPPQRLTEKPSQLDFRSKRICRSHWTACRWMATFAITAAFLGRRFPTSFLGSTVTRKDPTIDVISVGSISRQELLDTQSHTFGSHRIVRNFFEVTEKNDTDASCYTNFTLDQLEQVLTFCRNTEGQSTESTLFRTDLFLPKHHTGWMCAQKRPIDGLHIALERYKIEPLPDYLMIIDDDTYLNMDSLAVTFRDWYPPSESHLVAGCTYRRPYKLQFVFPIGGVGSILTRAAIEKLMKPIYCEANDPDQFTRLACWRLDQNLIGEKDFFLEGLSVGDLMYEYTARLPFTGVEQWKGTGYCFHSDHTLGYFFTYYHLAVPDGCLHADETPTDKFRNDYRFKKLVSMSKRRGFFARGHQREQLDGKGGECDNLKDKCSMDSRICHYVKSEQMESLYDEQQARVKWDD
jgi:hypothetical protein